MSLLKKINEISGNKDEEVITCAKQKRLWIILSKISGYTMYFEGHGVEEPYEGYEFESCEEEFYYNNNSSYLVLLNEEGIKSKFPIQDLKEYFSFDEICSMVRFASCNSKNIEPLKEGFVAVYLENSEYYVIEFNTPNDQCSKSYIYLNQNEIQEILMNVYDVTKDCIERKILQEISKKHGIIIETRSYYRTEPFITYYPDGAIIIEYKEIIIEYGNLE